MKNDMSTASVPSSVVITGVAGFIGYHTALRFLRAGYAVYGLDNLNDYYDLSLKEARLAQLRKRSGFHFQRLDICDGPALTSFLMRCPQLFLVVHLAAQAGVRYSLTHPMSYAHSNLLGFLQLLEACVQVPVPHLLYASSSSVYGANRKEPFNEGDLTDHPVSLYAATKKSNELMAHAYATLYGLPCTGLRFFTVYGPYGRPDMALFKFVRAIYEDTPIEVYNHGDMMRDFTFVDDVVESIFRVSQRPKPHPLPEATRSPAQSPIAPTRIYNIGSHAPVALTAFIDLLEELMGRPVKRLMRQMQKGDVFRTYADTSALRAHIDFAPKTSLREGVTAFLRWYADHYKVAATAA